MLGEDTIDTATHGPGPEHPREAAPDRRPARAERVRVALGGLNAWLVVLLVPVLHAGWGDATELAFAALPVVALALGLALLARRPEAAGWLLVAVFPPLLGLMLAVRDADATRGAYHPAAIALAALSVLGYFAVAAAACARPRAVRPVTFAPLAPRKVPVEEPSARRWLRRTLLTLGGAGAFSVAVVAPSLADPAAREAAWGDAAPEGSVLAALVGGVVAATALASVIGPALRAERRAPRPVAQRRSVAISLVLGAVALAGWAALRGVVP